MLSVSVVRTQIFDMTLPFPTDVYVSYHADPTSVDIHWIYNTTPNFEQIAGNVTYLGPCIENLQPQYSYTIVLRANQSKTNITYTLHHLEEFSNYSVSISGLNATHGRSPAKEYTFETQAGGRCKSGILY